MRLPLELVGLEGKSQSNTARKSRIIEKNGLIRAISPLQHLSPLQSLPSMVQTYEKELGALQRMNSEADSLFLERVQVDLARLETILMN